MCYVCVCECLCAIVANSHFLNRIKLHAYFRILPDILDVFYKEKKIKIKQGQHLQTKFREVEQDLNAFAMYDNIPHNKKI